MAFRGSPWNARGSPWNVRGSRWSVRGCPWNAMEIAAERCGGPWTLPRCSAKKRNNVHPSYLSLFVRVQRGVPNHLTPTHTLGPPRIASAGSYDTSSYCSIRLPCLRNTPPAYRPRDENASPGVRASVIPDTLLHSPKPTHRFGERIPYRRS